MAKKVAVNIGLALFGLLIAVGSVEIYLRLPQGETEASSLIDSSDPVASTTPFYQPDHPITGWYLNPNVEEIYRKSCFESYVKISSQGFRDVEHSLEKPDGVFRIVDLGDSFTAGLQVNLEATYSKVLERLLNEMESDTRFEVINLGMFSFGTGQEYLSLKHYGVEFQPDMVILAFFSNDVRDSYLPLKPYPGPPLKPYFFLDDSGELVILDQSDYVLSEEAGPARPFLNRVLFTTLGWLRLYDWIGRKVYKTPPIHNLFWKLGLVERKESPALEVYLRKHPPEYEEAWRIVKSLIRKIRQESEDQDAQFLLMNIAGPAQLASNRSLPWKYLNGVLRQLDLEKPTRTLAELSQEEGLEFLDLTPTFRDYMESEGLNYTSVHLECDGHWTSLGHQLAAGALFDKVTELVR